MIKLFDLKRQRTLISDSLDQRIATVLNKAQFILGDEVSELEDALTAYTGAKFCITCGNGTDSIQIALMSLNIGTGDDVIVPAFSYFSTAEAVAITGATPIYVDIALDDCLIETIDSARLVDVCHFLTSTKECFLHFCFFALEANKWQRGNDPTTPENVPN